MIFNEPEFIEVLAVVIGTCSLVIGLMNLWMRLYDDDKRR